MTHFVITCLFISLAVYLLLGGADFGAGILELFTTPRKRRHDQNIVYKAIGPIWEANHIWLILAIVILFVGFPGIHQVLVTNLHIPLTLLLVGIIFRGTAFVFRHYDAVEDGSRKVYDTIFRYSSLFTTFVLGLIAGSVLGNGLQPGEMAPDFLSQYVWPWLNPFSFSVGVFTAAICAFLAASYLIGEDDDDNHVRRFKKKAQIANLVVVLSGGAVLWAGGMEFWREFVWGWGGIGIVAASAATALFWVLLKQRKFILARVWAAGQVLLIIAAMGMSRFPELIQGMDLYDHAASGSTMAALGGALIFGLLLIGPSLYYLFRVFKVAD